MSESRLHHLLTVATSWLESQPGPKPEPKRFAALVRALNAPFTTAVLGALTLSVVGLVIEHRLSEAAKTRAAIVAREETRRQDLQRNLEIRRDFFLRFSESYLWNFDYLDSVLRREIWMGIVARHDDAERERLIATWKFSDGRTFAETREYWETMRAKVLERSDPIAVTQQAFALFELSQTQQALADLQAKFSDYRSTDDPATINKKRDEAMHAFTRAIAALREETLRDRNLLIQETTRL